MASSCSPGTGALPGTPTTTSPPAQQATLGSRALVKTWRGAIMTSTTPCGTGMMRCVASGPPTGVCSCSCRPSGLAVPPAVSTWTPLTQCCQRSAADASDGIFCCVQIQFYNFNAPGFAENTGHFTQSEIWGKLLGLWASRRRSRQLMHNSMGWSTQLF